jgi:2-(1,2-epoxy-1,2-dihydrophenyl)acetyl-CoA isomerase
MTDLVLMSIDGHVATLTMNRPEKKNAFTTPMLTQLVECLQQCRDNTQIRAIILTGAGDAFCSGGDIGDMREVLERGALGHKDDMASTVHPVLRAFADIDKPLIAAVNGVAAGAGLDFALMCDLIYIAAGARVGETYAKMALFPGAGGSWTLQRRVGVAKALEMFWTAELIDGAEAERIGLANKVLPDAELMPYVQKLARTIADGAPLSARYIKRGVLAGQQMDFRQSLDFISSQLGLCRSSNDHKEAVSAFFEKRKPVFHGN